MVKHAQQDSNLVKCRRWCENLKCNNDNPEMQLPRKETTNDEIDSLFSDDTCIVVNLPPGSRSIRCKWVFRMKYNIDWSLQTLKASLVAKGFK